MLDTSAIRGLLTDTPSEWPREERKFPEHHIMATNVFFIVTHFQVLSKLFRLKICKYKIDLMTMNLRN